MVMSRHQCCICQFYVVQINHIDGNPKNNRLDNLIPLCPNHHALFHSWQGMTVNYTPTELRMYRDRWYALCEQGPALAVGQGQALPLMVSPVRATGRRIR